MGHAFYEWGTDVVSLTRKSFKQVGKDDQLWIVEFYRESCGFCVKLRPHWEKVATNMKHLVHVAAVDVTKERQLASKYEISGVPTIKIFKKVNGKMKVEDYQGERKAKAIIDHISQSMPSFVQKITKKNSLESIQMPRLIVFSTKRTAPAILKAVSSKFEKRLSTVLVHKTQTEIISEYMVDTFPTILIETKPGTIVKYTRKFGYHALTFFVEKHLKKLAKEEL